MLNIAVVWRTPGARRAWAVALPCALASLLSACANINYTPVQIYRCPQNLDFEARLYKDMALLEGARGFAVLERQPAAEGESESTPRYADATLRASFGLGVDQRLARLDYTGIPEPVYCHRATTDDDGATPSVRASLENGPRPPPPFNPDAPVETNVRTDHGPVRVGY